MKSKIRIKRKPDRADDTLANLHNHLRGASLVKVGLPRGSNEYPDGTSVIKVGVVHEFGARISRTGVNGPYEIIIPERSFLRTTLQQNKKAYKALIKKLLLKVIINRLSTIEALETVGLKVQTDVREKITDIDQPPLKHRDGNPLVDTGHLRQSITYQVDE